MSDIDKIIKKIMMDDTFQPLREKYIINLKSKTDTTADFEIFTSNFKPNKHSFMKVELLHVVENINDEASEILDYKILKINQRIRLNTDFNNNSSTMLKYDANAYSIKLLALNDTRQRILYYLLYIYEPFESLDNLLDSRKISYSTEELIHNLLNICYTVKECHGVETAPIYHNDISLENIFASPNGEYKLGKIDMKHFVNFSKDENLSASNELSARNDICMIGNVIQTLANKTSKKNQAKHSRLLKIASKACKKTGGYKNIDEVISDLNKASSKNSKIPATVIIAVVAVLLVGAGIFTVPKLFSKQKVGDTNGDGYINQVDVTNLQNLYSELMRSSRKLSNEEKAVYDINKDGYIDVIDVSYLLGYIEYQEKNGVKIDMEEYIEITMNEE